MNKKQRGFSLIELLVVLVILGLLAGLVGPRVMRYLGGAKTDTAKLQIADLGAALDIYRLETGNYPSTDEGLQALMADPGDKPGWNGPYLKKKTLPKDPWGKPYQYAYPGEHGDFDLFTLGRDNAPGGEGEDEDMNSWD